MSKDMIGYHWLCVKCRIKSLVNGKCPCCGKQFSHHNYPEVFFSKFNTIREYKIKRNG